MGIDVFNSAKLPDKLNRSLLADTGDTGDIVRWVTHQPFEVGNMLRLNAIFFADRGFIVELGITETFSRFGIKYFYMG